MPTQQLNAIIVMMLTTTLVSHHWPVSVASANREHLHPSEDFPLATATIDYLTANSGEVFAGRLINQLHDGASLAGGGDHDDRQAPTSKGVYRAIRSEPEKPDSLSVPPKQQQQTSTNTTTTTTTINTTTSNAGGIQTTIGGADVIVHEREFVSPLARVQMDCQRDKTLIKVNFTKSFSGILGAGKLATTKCKLFGNGTRFYELQVSHNATDCDIQWDSLSSGLINTLFIRFHQTLETGNDIAKNIMCRLKVGDLIVGRRRPLRKQPQKRQQQQKQQQRRSTGISVNDGNNIKPA